MQRLYLCLPEIDEEEVQEAIRLVPCHWADMGTNPILVQAGVGASSQKLTSGEILTAGDACYKASNSFYLKAQSNGNSVQSGLNGIAIALASTPGAGQPFQGLTSGPFSVGNSVVANGQLFCVSNTPGKIAPFSDLVQGNYVTLLGQGGNSNTIQMSTGGAIALGALHF